MLKRLPFLTLAAVTLAISHPMGNFSVSHYARFDTKAGGVDVTYAIDLAELPTFDLLRQWGLERNSPQAALDRKGAEQARDWTRHLDFTSNGKPVAPKFLRSEVFIADGAGNLPILRITSHLHLDPPATQLNYEDHNYPDRAGWKEIVISPNADRSQALTAYPQDPTIAPPQDVRASFEWTGQVSKTKPIITAVPQPKAPAPVPPAATTPAGAPAGTVVKGDYLSRFLHQRDLSLSMILIALGVAFVLGAAHALTPGHGKTIVAAYLVGSRGTLKHAAFLGAMVTFTHTVSVFLLGLATLFLFQYVMPEKITQALGVISGLSIVAIGAYMLWKRYRAIRHVHHHHDHAPAQAHSHTHDHHEHAHTHDHDHQHEPAHAHAHDHAHTHDHDHAVVHAHSHEHDHQHEPVHVDALDHDHAHDHQNEPSPSHTHDHDHALVHAHSHSHDHQHAPANSHTHDHPDHDHSHSHDHHHHEHPHTHQHSHGKLVHSHGPGGHVHSHDVPDEISWASLSALAISGGLVPCESALVLLLSAIALGRVGLGLLLLISFSLGLAVVLMGIGVLVIYAKNLFPKRDPSERHPAFQWIPVASAAIVMIIGVLMTGVSLGWIQTKWVV